MPSVVIYSYLKFTAWLYLRSVCWIKTAFHGLRCHPLACIVLKLRLSVDSSPTGPTKILRVISQFGRPRIRLFSFLSQVAPWLHVTFSHVSNTVLRIRILSIYPHRQLRRTDGPTLARFASAPGMAAVAF